jgi:CHAT domain-containing protein
MDTKACALVHFRGMVIGAMLALALAPPAEAQGGSGQGRGRDRFQGQGRQAPQPQLAPGQYSFLGPDVLEAINRGEGPQALAYFETAAKEAEQQGNLVRAAHCYHAISMIANRNGRYQKGIQASSRAIELFKKSSTLTPQAQSALASSYSHLGAAYRQVGDLTKARSVFEEGLAYAKAGMSGRAAGNSEGYLLNELATIAFMQKDYQTALRYNTRAAQYFETEEANAPPQMGERMRTSLRRWAAASFVGIGRDQQALGNADAADAAYAKGLKYAKLSGLREVETQMVGAQANAALAKKDWAKALALYQQAIALYSQTKMGNISPGLYQGQSRALEGLGRFDEALVSMRESVRLIEEVRADLTDSDLRSEFFEGKQGLYQHAVLLALEAQQPEEAFSLSERSRSRTFLDLLGSQTTLSKGRTRALVAEEVQLRARLAQARAQAQETEDAEESAYARATAEALDRDYKAFLERVKKENLEQASLMSVEPVKLAEIQALLPEGTTLLEYFVGDGGVVAVWVVDRQNFKVVKLPGDRPTLVTQVRNFRGAITRQAPIENVQRQAQALYERLIAPARAEIRGTRLLIVPHGVLHYLPFASLRSPNGRWLVQDFPLSTLPSASVLRYLTDKGVGARAGTLVMGNPDLGAELALPWAEREARMVGQQEKDSTVLVRADATEAQAKKLLETVGIVHFATHGDLSETDPLSSAVLLVPGGGEDGRLEVREVFGLDLHAKLVVLSACETGLGKLSRGDELVGLQRAFLYAGTPAVVTTLWKVDDRATFDLIRAFYTRLETAGPVEALRQAQLETMATYPHPYQWAAFGLTGAPR